jgi:dipeptidase D
VIATDDDISLMAKKFEDKEKCESDSGLKITIASTQTSPTCFDKNSTHAVVDFLNKVPNGIIKWSDNIDNLVESSLNLGILKTTEDTVVSSFLVRSSVNSDKIRIAEELENLIKSYGGTISNSCDNPAWEYNSNSPLRDKMIEVYKKMYGENPQVLAIHAGLECSLLSEKLLGLDAVSIGPNMYNIHTVKESLSIDSVERVYNYLINLLKEI